MKTVFNKAYGLLVWLTAVVAVTMLLLSPRLPWLGVLLMSAAPAVQQLHPYDAFAVPHHKARLPRVSLLVMAGLGWVLVTVTDRGWELWLAFANLGGFLLNTYWATEPNGSVRE